MKLLKNIIKKRFDKSINYYIHYKIVSKLYLLITNILSEKYIFSIYILSLTIID